MKLTDSILPYSVLIVVFLVLTAVFMGGSMVVGYTAIPLYEVWQNLTGFGSPVTGPHAIVVSEIRLPRTLLAAFIGATLGLAGAALQGLLRNPLAEPGVIGISASASLGAVIVLYFGIGTAFVLTLPFAAILGALLSVMLLYLIAGRDGSVSTLILAGIAINSFAAALSALALNLSPNHFAALEIAFWMLGSVSDRTMDHVAFAAPLMVAGWILLLSAGRALDALTLGEETAQGLGINLDRARFQVIAGTALSVGAAVSVSGAIGFVGLVVPHILRPIVGYQPSRLLPVSALGGAVLVLGADMVVRLIPTQPEVKLGVITALIGAPFFLHLVLQMRKGRI